MNDARFHALREALSAYASDADDPPIRPDGRVQAAVAVVLRKRPDDLDLLLIKRAHHPRDPWSGHMALPGGRRDASDASLLHTALRETREETGVTLPGPESPAVLGRLDAVAPRSVRLPDVSITPFVFAVDEGTHARAASPEVERVHWVSLEVLRDPASADTVEIEVPDGARAFPCLRVGDDVVWGLTYQILTDFFARLPDAAAGSG
jgi:8-oxo-dGTP pyrophosphatase MutT (NUDIX family)